MSENTTDITPMPNPKTSGVHNSAADMSDMELDMMFQMTIGQHCLMQDNLEHGLEAAHVWG